MKRGGDLNRLDLDSLQSAIDSPPAELLVLDEALKELAIESPQKAELVKLRFYAGCTIDEAAAILGVSATTAKRYWTTAHMVVFGNQRELAKIVFFCFCPWSFLGFLYALYYREVKPEYLDGRRNQRKRN